MEAFSVDWGLDLDFNLDVGSGGRRVCSAREEVSLFTDVVGGKTSEVVAYKPGCLTDAIWSRFHRGGNCASYRWG